MSGRAADRLGDSPSFAAVAHRPRSSRGRLIGQITGDIDDGDETPTQAPLSHIAPLPFNPRRRLRGIAEAADSLLQHGQIQPTTVVSRRAFLAICAEYEEQIGDARWVIVDGGRRYAAAQQAGLEVLDIAVDDTLATSKDDLFEKAFIANFHREDVEPLDEAEALAHLVEVHGSHREVARRLGMTHPWVGQRLALLNLSPKVQEQLRDGQITVEDARRIARLPHDQQDDAAATAGTDRASRNKARKERRTRGTDPAAGNGVSTGAADSSPADLGETPAVNGVSAAAGGSADPATGTGGNGVSTPVSAAAAGPAPPGGGNGVSTAPGNPAPAIPDEDAPGNGVSSADVATSLEQQIETWDDLPAIVAVLRSHLTEPRLCELAALITS